jgi:hypothetical protein
MKKLREQLIVLLTITVIIFSCNKSDDDPGSGWTDDDKASYQQVISVQDEIGNDLDGWLQTMDSLDAINQAYQAFISSENVSSATINSQGIAVQYANGMRGGLLLNPEDDNTGLRENKSLENLSYESGNGLKSMVSQRKMILINPHYWERSYFTDQIKSIDEGNLSKVDMTLSTFYKNEEATVDRFTELSGYGIIHIYTHGWAWPKRQNITDVYLLTGEVVNEATSKKYWDELKTGNIPIVKTAYLAHHRKNVYLISKEFVTNYNDFSKDTILFYGGFCYSFLGNWPDIIDEFADGAYTGYDWKVYTHKNANWCVNSLFNLSDTTADQPITLNDWFNSTEVPKSYWNSVDQRYVTIHYAGDGNLKLWDDVTVSLKALSPDGKPVTSPGEAGVSYPFKCTVNTNISTLEYLWDIGDGTNPATTQGNEVNITWGEEGSFQLSVTAKNKTTGASLGTAKLMVTIGNESNEIIDILKECNYTVVYLYGSGAINHWNFLDCSWTIDDLLDWDGLNFSGSSQMNGLTKTITGNVSSSGQTINFTVTKEGTVLGYDMQIKIKMTVENYPIHSYQYNQVEYKIDPPGGTSYVTNLEGFITSGGETNVLSTSDFNWGSLDEFRIYFTKSN